MSSSSAPKTYSQTFSKRRRAFVACSNCRKRKIKCVTASDADDNPCTRCLKKGLTCEYAPVSDNEYSASDSSPPNTPSAEIQPQTRNSGRSRGSQSYAPPHAGTSGFLNTAPQLPPRGRRTPVPSAGGSQLHLGGAVQPPYQPPYQYAQDPALYAHSSTSAHTQQLPSRPQSVYPYDTYQQMAPAYMQTPSAAPQYYPGSARHRGASNHFSANIQLPQLYNPNYGQAYAQPADTMRNWPSSTSSCICPPGGPCYCGANYNNQ
ncbi:hypothetical protein B0H11DRAFT_2284192 [Mycena galericulata]|nr:hypothetical protein B0H11DRAFT_2284192 [Mycena galericulata]